MVRLYVEVPEDVPPTPPGGVVNPEDARIKVGFELLQDAMRVGRDFMTAYLDRVRSTYGQPWLGLAGQPPRATFTNELFDQHGAKVRIGIGETAIMRGKNSDAALTPDSHARLLSELEAGHPLSLAETLLADASYLLAYAEEPHLRQAVLLCAIACEVQIKRVLVTRASGAQRDLVDVLLANPRDFTLAAVTLFDKVSAAVFGRSLREEDRELFKAASRLYEVRNQIAHRGGADLAEEEMRDAVVAGQRAFAWARSLLVDDGST